MVGSVSERALDGEGPWTTLRLPAEAASASTARRQMVTALRLAGLPESLVADAQLVLSELVANGVEHGMPFGDGTIVVSWQVNQELLSVSVCDGGAAKVLQPAAMDVESDRGRGLMIVDTLCDSWGVELEGGTRITAKLDRLAYANGLPVS